MKKTAGFIIIFLLVSATFYSQPRRTHEERAKMLKEQLNLTDEQTLKVDSIYAEADKKFATISNGQFDRAKFRSVMNDTNKEIEKILTKDQNEKYQKILEERRNRMRENRN